MFLPDEFAFSSREIGTLQSIHLFFLPKLAAIWTEFDI